MSGAQDKSKRLDKNEEKTSVETEVDKETHLKIWEGLKEGIEGANIHAGTNVLCGKVKVRFRMGDLDFPERMRRYTGDRVVEEVNAQSYPCAKATEGESHILAE